MGWVKGKNFSMTFEILFLTQWAAYLIDVTWQWIRRGSMIGVSDECCSWNSLISATCGTICIEDSIEIGYLGSSSHIVNESSMKPNIQWYVDCAGSIVTEKAHIELAGSNDVMKAATGGEVVTLSEDTSIIGQIETCQIDPRFHGECTIGQIHEWRINHYVSSGVHGHCLIDVTRDIGCSTCHCSMVNTYWIDQIILEFPRCYQRGRRNRRHIDTRSTTNNVIIERNIEWHCRRSCH